MPLDCVTGAFGFSGRFIARRLIERGRAVRTLTDHPDPASPLAAGLDVRPYSFHDRTRLVRDLEGVETLYNTYWVRFERGDRTYERAVGNTRLLFAAAREAGVERVVQVSIANPELAPDLPYYRGKARIERDLERSGLGFAVVRPTVLFGDEGILIHNIAWLLRHLPLFGVVGGGDYRLQPVHVDDLARLCVERGESGPDGVCDAAGPEILRFAELVEHIRGAVGSRARILHLPQVLGLAAARGLGLLLRDVLITRDELVGLQRELLVSREPPAGRIRLGDWIDRHADSLGARYRSEIARHFARPHRAGPRLTTTCGGARGS